MKSAKKIDERQNELFMLDQKRRIGSREASITAEAIMDTHLAMFSDGKSGMEKRSSLSSLGSAKSIMAIKSKAKLATSLVGMLFLLNILTRLSSSANSFLSEKKLLKLMQKKRLCADRFTEKGVLPVISALSFIAISRLF